MPELNFRRAEPIWPFCFDGETKSLTVHGSIKANSGETLLQLALGVGIARAGSFGIGRAIAEGRPVPLLERYSPGDREVQQAVFVGSTISVTQRTGSLYQSESTVARSRRSKERFLEEPVTVTQSTIYGSGSGRSSTVLIAPLLVTVAIAIDDGTNDRQPTDRRRPSRMAAPPDDRPFLLAFGRRLLAAVL